MRILVNVALLLFVSIYYGRAADTIRVAAFVKPDTFEDATPGIRKAIAACKNKPGAVLLFEPGRYDLWPEAAEEREYFISNTSSETECPSKLKKIALLFERMNGLTVEGNGALLVAHGKMIHWALDHCSNITLQHISFDYERPTMSEMTLTAVSDKVVEAAVHPDSRYTILNGQLRWYGEGWGMRHFHTIRVNPSEGTLWYDAWGPFQQSRAEQLAPGKVRFTGDFSARRFDTGQVLTVRDPIRDHVGAFINRSAGIRLKNVQMHYMHGLGIIAQFSENLAYDSVMVMPREGSGRKIAAFADCMHFSGCRGEISITNCRFNGAHDDPVNVHGTHLQVTEIVSPNSVKLRFMHPQTYGMEAFFAGDSVALVQPASLHIYARNVVKQAKLVSPREMLVELATPLPASLKTGDAVENLTWTPSLTVRNCRFEGTNTRGLLVTTRRKVLIEHNTFYRTGMHAILIANDAAGWYESGPVHDVTIRNNEFRECGYNSGKNNYPIAIEPENKIIGKGQYVHHNIRITGNTFYVYDYPVLKAKSTKGLTFTGNNIIRTGFMKAGPKRPAIHLEACADVKVAGNEGEPLD